MVSFAKFTNNIGFINAVFNIIYFIVDKLELL